MQAQLVLLRAVITMARASGKEALCATPMYPSSAGDGNGGRAGIGCVHAAPQGASEGRVERVKLSRSMHSNGHAVGWQQLGRFAGGAL